eukprot:2565521-Prymnesium_polylepis.1
MEEGGEDDALRPQRNRRAVVELVGCNTHAGMLVASDLDTDSKPAKAALRAAGKATICMRRSPRSPRSSPTESNVSQAQLDLYARSRATLILR